MTLKFSISRLERARSNPAAFANSLTTPDQFWGQSKSQRWLNAICGFHKSTNIEDAVHYLEDKFGHRKNTSQNRKELQKLINAVTNYETQITQKELAYLRSKEPITVYAHDDLRITGQIPLLFMTPNGFAGYFVEKENSVWESELRFPLVQASLAKIFDTDVSVIQVGYINFLTGDVEETSFTLTEIQEANDELEYIAETIIHTLI